MASMSFELEALQRSTAGRGASRRLRQNEQLPAIVYGAGEPPVSLVLDHRKVVMALSHESFYSRILSLKIEGKSEKVILKAVQRHPIKPRVLHMDFLRVRADQKLHMHIPLHFIGEDKSPALEEGGVFSHGMTDLEVICLPKDLPEFIEVDVSEMKLNDVIHLSNLKLPKGVEIAAFSHGVEGHDLSVVSIHIPRVVEEPVEMPEEEAAPAGEVSAEVPAIEQKAPEAGDKDKGKAK